MSDDIRIWTPSNGGLIRRGYGPGVPTSLAGTPTATSIAISWSASTDPIGGSVDHYEVFLNGSLIQSLDALGYTATGLATGTVYVVGVRAVSNLSVPSELATVSVTTGGVSPAPQKVTKWGASIGPLIGESKSAARTRITAGLGGDYSLGPLQVIRDFYTDTLPWPLQGGIYDIYPDQTYIVSWHPNMADATSGALDSYVTNWVNSVTKPVVFSCMDHEPDAKVEAGNYSAAAWVASWNKIASVVRAAGNPLVRTAPIYANYHYATRWPALTVDLSLADAVYYDPYRGAKKTYNQGYDVIKAQTDWIFANWGVPTNRVGIAEIGTGVQAPVLDPALWPGMAAAMQGMMQSALDRNLEAICWFESGTAGGGIGELSQSRMLARPPVHQVWIDLRTTNQS